MAIEYNNKVLEQYDKSSPMYQSNYMIARKQKFLNWSQNNEKTKWPKDFSALFIIVSMLAILSPTIDTKAFSGRDRWRGYFYNQLDYYGPDVFSGGITISGGTQGR